MFITFEGGDAAGKSTQARLLAEALGAVLTREPGGSPGAEALRGLLLGELRFAPRAETMLHFAARIDHVAQVIRPALAAGRLVVCDRFTDSTRAYQGAGLGVDAAFIEALAAMVGLQPELTIMLEVSDAVGRQRLAGRGGGLDRYERLGAAFHARVAAGFAAIAAAEPKRCVRVSADGDVESVHRAVLAVVRERLG